MSSSTHNHEYSTQLDLDFGPDGCTLVPVVTQDIDTREVLILSWVNREAFERSRQTGKAVYWSRSRNCLWEKGKTSGNELSLCEVRINCEQNSLLYLVRQTGSGACHALRADGSAHTGCYYRRILADNTLEFLED